jgi:acyl-lipid omega-6 desaturase (Delta-12 desaturase)
VLEIDTPIRYMQGKVEPNFGRQADNSDKLMQLYDPQMRAALIPSVEGLAENTETDAKILAKFAAQYREPSRVRSLFELIVTIGALILLWVAMWASLQVGYWLTLLLAIPTAGFIVRVFMIQHDCGHGAFFRKRSVNDWVGRVLGILTLTPYDVWRRAHALHHATNGNLDRRGIGDIDTVTVREYRARSWLGRLAYRLYRHPAVMFGVGPVYLFFLKHRLPFGMMRDGWRPWVSSLATNAAIALAIIGMMALVGTSQFLLIQLPITLLAASIGVWLFYVQHQFETTLWAHEGEWNLQEAAVHGSSHYDLPGILRWFTANIGIHHVHHLCSRIPYYRLPQVLRDHPHLVGLGRVTFIQSLRSVRLTLWDEARGQLVSFRQVRGSKVL